MSFIGLLFIDREGIVQSWDDYEQMAQGYEDCVMGRPCIGEVSDAYKYGYGSAYHDIERGAANAIQ